MLARIILPSGNQKRFWRARVAFRAQTEDSAKYSNKIATTNVSPYETSALSGWRKVLLGA